MGITAKQFGKFGAMISKIEKENAKHKAVEKRFSEKRTKHNPEIQKEINNGYIDDDNT